MLNQFGGRKFVAFFFVSVLFTILLLAGKDTKEFLAFISAIYGLFVLGNGLENLKK